MERLPEAYKLCKLARRIYSLENIMHADPPAASYFLLDCGGIWNPEMSP